MNWNPISDAPLDR